MLVLLIAHQVDPDEDKHKAPSLPRIHPLSLQDGADSVCHSLFRSSKFIRAPGSFSSY